MRDPRNISFTNSEISPDLPTSLADFIISALGRNGIFLPFFDIVSLYKRYIFSRLNPGLYLIKGISFVEWIFLNITPKGKTFVNPVLIMILK